jgi:phosphatidylinositol alpha 1,6-mannosyltransferase
VTSHQIYTIAFLAATFPPEVSGSAQYNWERIQWFAKQGKYRVVVLAPDCQNPSSLPSVPSDLAENLIIETYPSQPWLLYKPHYVPIFSAARQINHRLAYYKPDLIVAVDLERLFLFSTWQLPGRRYAKENGIPYLTEFHTDYYNFSSTYPAGKWVRDLSFKPLMNYLYRQCDTTIVSSKFASSILHKIGVFNDEIVSFVGIDVSSYHPNRRNRKCLAPWLSDAEQEHKVLLFLGRLAFEKQVDLLIKAFAQLKQTQEKCSLLIVGDGPDDVVNFLKRLAKPIPHIYFTGFIEGEQKANLLASCDVFCSPSPYETLGRTVVEAMASGIPVVTVDSGAVSDYIIDGVNGYLVPPNNVEELTNTLQKVLPSNNQEMIQYALQSAKQFSIEKTCQNLHEYYQNLFESLKFTTQTKSTRSLEAVSVNSGN